MKRISIILISVLSVNLGFAQAPTSKIALVKGQKIQGAISLSTEANLSMGMEVQSNSSSEISLEVENITATTSVLNNTLQKLKVNMDMMGKSMSYDSEKPEDQNTDIGKAFGSKMNVPVEVTVDNSTGKMIDDEKDVEVKKEDDTDPMGSIMQLFGAANDEDPVSGAFILLPQGKKVGDSWSDSTVAKNSKTVRNYTLKSIDGKEAVIQVTTLTDATGDIEMQGMQMTVVTNAKTTGDIVADISTSLVKKKSMTTETTGNLQVAGQEVPISAKTTFTATYK